MLCVNDDVEPSHSSLRKSRDKSVLMGKMSSLAMANFAVPSLSKTIKIKSCLKSVIDMSITDGNRLIVSDNKDGKVISFSSLQTHETGRSRDSTVLIQDLSPQGISRCPSPTSDALAVVHSSEWDECVKIISSKNSGQIYATWGRGTQHWTPRAVAFTDNDHVIVSNIHPQASSRLAVYSLQGQEVCAFGRPAGPGNLSFRQPGFMAIDNVTSRVIATDVQTNSIKVFDLRGHYVCEFGSKPGDQMQKLDQPMGVCCDRRGNVIVCDSGNDRLAMYCNDGRFICNLLNFNKGQRKSRLNQNRQSPVAVALSEAGDQLIVALDNRSGDKGTFRKITIYDVQPEL